jgi:hypothetical protein
VIDHWDEIIKLSRPELENLYLSRRKSKKDALEFSNQVLKKVSIHAK